MMAKNSVAVKKYMRIMLFNLLLSQIIVINLFAQQTNNLEIIWQKTGSEYSHNFGLSLSSGDFNNDGFSDVIVYGDSDYTHKAYIFFGSQQFDSLPDVVISSDTTWGFILVKGIGDINNDGYDDIAFGNQNGPDGYGRVYIFLGSNPFNTICDFQIRGPHYASLFGQAISSGDVNGDGYSDLIVGAYGASVPPVGYLAGKVYIYFGGPSFDTMPDVILKGGHHKNEECFGADLSNCVDVNTDGFDDLIIGAYGFGMCHGRLYIYYGGNPMDSIADVTMMGEGPYQFLGWDAIGGLKKVDDYDCAITGAICWPNGWSVGNGKIYILFGGNPMDSIPDLSIIGRTPTSGLSQSLSRTGYLSTIQNDALISGVPREDNLKGYAYIWRQDPYFDTIPDAWIQGTQYDQGIGWNVTSAGDFDGDARDEIMISNYASGTVPNRVWVCKYTGVGIEENYLPISSVRLPLEVYPNPVRSVLRVRCPFSVQDMKVYNIIGDVVKILKVNSRQNIENREIIWDLMDENSRRVANGIYFVEVIAENNGGMLKGIRKIEVVK
jgi:hypothetical protein